MKMWFAKNAASQIGQFSDAGADAAPANANALLRTNSPTAAIAATTVASSVDAAGDVHSPLPAALAPDAGSLADNVLAALAQRSTEVEVWEPLNPAVLDLLALSLLG